MLDSDNLGLNVVTARLNELESGGPGSLTIVTHPPRLAENISTDDLMLVREALLNKAGGVAHLLLRGSWLRALALPSVVVRIDMVVLRASCSACIGHTTFRKILADQLVRSLTMLANFDKRVLIVLWLASTLLAEVCVSIMRAHVADTLDRVHLTAITDDVVVNLLSLLSMPRLYML